MKRQPRTTSLLRFLLPAVCLLFLISGLLYLGPMPQPDPFAPLATVLGLVLALATWGVYSREICDSQKGFDRISGPDQDGLEGLSSNLAKLSTGNLATKAPVSSFPPSISVKGELGTMAPHRGELGRPDPREHRGLQRNHQRALPASLLCRIRQLRRGPDRRQYHRA